MKLINFQLDENFPTSNFPTQEFLTSRFSTHIFSLVYNLGWVLKDLESRLACQACQHVKVFNLLSFLLRVSKGFKSDAMKNALIRV